MTDYEILMVVLGLLTLLVMTTSSLLALISYLDKRNDRSKK